MRSIDVAPAPGPELREPLRLLEGWLRDGEPLPDGFVAHVQRLVGTGDLEVLAARLGDRPVGVIVLAFRPSVSLGATFASVEDLYVVPEARRRGVGGALLRAAHARCSARGVSYLEAQVEEDGAGRLYAALGYGPEPGVRVFSTSLPVPLEKQSPKGGSGSP